MLFPSLAGFRALAYTENSRYAVIGTDRYLRLQFHPEVTLLLKAA